MKKIAVFIHHHIYFDLHIFLNYMNRQYEECEVDYYVDSLGSTLPNVYRDYNLTTKKIPMDDISMYLDDILGWHEVQEKFGSKEALISKKTVNKIKKKNYDEYIVTNLGLSIIKNINPDMKTTLFMRSWLYGKENAVYTSHDFINFTRFDEILTSSVIDIETLGEISEKISSKIKKIPIYFSKNDEKNYKRPLEKYINNHDYWDWNSEVVENVEGILTFNTPISFSMMTEFEKICTFLNEFGNYTIAYRMFDREDDYSINYVKKFFTKKFPNLNFIVIDFFNSTDIFSKTKLIMTNDWELRSLGVIRALRNGTPAVRFPHNDSLKNITKFFNDDQSGLFDIIVK